MAEEQGGKYRKFTHTVYQCNYHIVWVPKYRYRVLEGSIKEAVEHDTRALCEWKEVEVIELSVQPDHIHLVCSIPPKLAAKEVHGVSEGEAGDQDFQELPTPEGEAILGQPLLGEGLLCQHGRDGRGFDPTIRTLPGGRGKEAGAPAGWLRFVFMRRDPLSGVAIGTDKKPPPLGVVVH